MCNAVSVAYSLELVFIIMIHFTVSVKSGINLTVYSLDLVRVRIRSLFGLKYPVLSSEKQLQMS